MSLHNCFGFFSCNIVHFVVSDCRSTVGIMFLTRLIMCIGFMCVVPKWMIDLYYKNLFRCGAYNKERSPVVDRWSVLPAGRTAAKGFMEAYAVVRRPKYRCLDG